MTFVLIEPHKVKTLLDSISGPGSWEWTKMDDIKPGDRVSWWTQAAEVLSIERVVGGFNLTVWDQVTGTKKTFLYKDSEKLRMLKAEPCK